MSEPPAILIVDDEADIRELLRYNLIGQGYTVTEASDGETALAKARDLLPELILLDLMLPGISGLDVCRALRVDPSTSKIPILMLTAKGEESDIVAGLDLGADDYVTKPFSMAVLLARVATILRRSKEAFLDMEKKLIHGITIHRGRRMVFIENHEIALTYSEFELLDLLTNRPGWVLTRNQIIDGIRGEGHPVTDRSVDVILVGLRKKLGAAASAIETIRGVGYRLIEEA